MSLKRKGDEGSGALVVSKKQRTDSSNALIAVESRTSRLQAPTMLLEGHQSEVYAVKFSPDGQCLASTGFEKQIFLWEVYGECQNYAVLKGHKNAVMEIAWSRDSKYLYSASADKTAAVFDCDRLKISKRMAEHSSYVSSICPARETSTCVTCSDDGTAKVWDYRAKVSSLTLPHQYPLTAVAFDEKGEHVFSGGIDNLIHCWDIRKPNTELYRLLGHSDTITSLRLDPYGSYLLSNAMDEEVKVWDIRPFAPSKRCIKTFTGAKNLLKANWSSDGLLVASGSSDRMVYIWDTTTRDLKYLLPGHNGCVNEVSFHPKEPIIASCGSDRKIYLGEIEKTVG